MTYIKVLIQVEADSFLHTTRATFEISALMSIEYGNGLKPDELIQDLKNILRLVGEKDAIVTLYLQTGNQYPYTTIKAHRYVKEKTDLKFAFMNNGMFENWHTVNTKSLQNRVIEYVDNANELMFEKLRNLALK